MDEDLRRGLYILQTDMQHPVLTSATHTVGHSISASKVAGSGRRFRPFPCRHRYQHSTFQTTPLPSQISAFKVAGQVDVLDHSPVVIDISFQSCRAGRRFRPFPCRHRYQLSRLQAGRHCRPLPYRHRYQLSKLQGRSTFQTIPLPSLQAGSA